MARTIRPSAGRFLVKCKETKDITPGGIHIPESAQEEPSEGVIILAGPNKMRNDGTFVEPQVKKNDRILFIAYAGTAINWDGEEFLLLEQEDILAVLEE